MSKSVLSSGNSVYGFGEDMRIQQKQSLCLQVTRLRPHISALQKLQIEFLIFYTYFTCVDSNGLKSISVMKICPSLLIIFSTLLQLHRILHQTRPAACELMQSTRIRTGLPLCRFTSNSFRGAPLCAVTATASFPSLPDEAHP